MVFRFRLRDLQLPQFQNRQGLAVHQEGLLTVWQRFSVALFPNRGAAQLHRVVGMLVAEWRKGGDENFAQFRALEARARMNNGRRPEQIAQPFWRLDLDAGDVSQRQPHALSGREDFEARSDAGIGVLDALKRFTVPTSAWQVGIGSGGIFLALK